MSPAVNYCGDCTVAGLTDPYTYLKDFFAACTGCEVDYIGVHWYNCDLPSLQGYLEGNTSGLEGFVQFGKPIWLTEFACDTTHSVADQTAYMEAAVPYLESSPYVYRYSWFSAGPIPNAVLMNANGTLTALRSTSGYPRTASRAGRARLAKGPGRAIRVRGASDRVLRYATSVAIRLVRALWLFATILASYLLHFGLVRAFRPRGGSTPDWLKARRGRSTCENAHRRLLRGMLRLRGVFIKLGQVLSILGGFLPRAFTRELESLQDNVPPHPFRAVEKTFLASFGRRPDECFAVIDREPIAAASLGQVHAAVLKDGRKVAVKVLYPHIRDVIRVDMRALKLIVGIVKRWLPVQHLETVHPLARRPAPSPRRTTSTRRHCMERMAKNFAGEPDILFPEVVHEWTRPDILTMSFMEGVKITRFDELDRLGVDRKKLATPRAVVLASSSSSTASFMPTLTPAISSSRRGPPAEPRIVVLDFGAISEVSDTLVDGALEVLQGIMTRATARWRCAAFRGMGFVAEGANEASSSRRCSRTSASSSR